MDDSQERAQPIRFGVFEIDRASRELRKQGRRIRLQDQPFQVLRMLLERAGSVVTREELREALWPGSVYVDFDHGLNNAIARLRDALGDNAASPQYIETLPRLGYRFIYPLQDPPPPAAPASDERRAWSWHLTGYAAAAATVLALLLWLVLRDDAATPPGTASVAVLPFVSLSADADDEYFADGLSDSLLNHLARVRGLRVPGRTASFYFKGRQEPAAEIAGHLGVSHLLEGSVRRAGNRLRIAARLTDAASGYQLWSQTFERDFGDLFEIEDEIALSVVSALKVELLESGAEQGLRRGTQSVEAYRLYLVGLSKLRARGVRLDREGARRHFEQAVALDPGYAAAHAGLASYRFNRATSSFDAPEENTRVGREHAERAYALDPKNADALRVMADFEILRFRYRDEFDGYVRAIGLFDRAVRSEPNNAYVHYDYARAVQWQDPKRALPLFERAAELDPEMPLAIGMAALSLLRLGMHDAARLRMEQMVARAGVDYGVRNIAVLESYLGRLDEAVRATRAGTPPFEFEAGTRVAMWGLHLSMGDRAGAIEVLREPTDDPLILALADAAELTADGRHAAAFESLDRRRGDYPGTRLLDLPAARLALIAGRSGRAREILESRLPDLARGRGPITAPRVLPGLDLVRAWSQSGEPGKARELLQRIEAFLDGPDAPRLPLFTVLRARAHALAGRQDRAWEALDRAHAEGFRMTCVLDLHPHPLLYVDCIDADPVFATAPGSVQFRQWLARIHADNRRQFQQLQSRLAAAGTS